MGLPLTLSLELALQGIGPDLAADLHFQPFELNPRMAADGEDAAEHLKAKYGMDDAQLAQSREVLHARGEAVGFRFGARPRIWNTFDAHRLLHWAGLNGRQRELKHALLQAYHGQARNPGAADVLLELARQVGLATGEAAAVIRSGAYAAEVREAQRVWQQAGIRAVPSVVVDQRHLIQGGQPPEVFEQALRRIAQEAGSR